MVSRYTGKKIDKYHEILVTSQHSQHNQSLNLEKIVNRIDAWLSMRRRMRLRRFGPWLILFLFLNFPLTIIFPAKSTFETTNVVTILRHHARWGIRHPWGQAQSAAHGQKGSQNSFSKKVQALVLYSKASIWPFFSFTRRHTSASKVEPEEKRDLESVKPLPSLNRYR